MIEQTEPSAAQVGNGSRAWLGAGLVSLATALAILAPFFWLGTASGHDIQFHISSWLDAAGQWKEGILFPRWTEWANYGFGEPRFIFYPPLSWIFGAGLGSVLPWTWIPAVFVLCVQTFAGISAFALARRFTSGYSPALLGAVAYAANPYALLVIYTRSDYAELLATSFYPLLFLFALQLCGFLESDSQPRRSIFWCGFFFAAVWLSNAPAGVLASYSLALLFLWAALRQKSLLPLVRGGFGLALGLGLAAFYIIPAAYEQRWVNIYGALATGLAPSDNFLFAITADPEHDAFNRIASYIAVLLMLWALAAAFAVWRKKDIRQGSATPLRAYWAMGVLAVVASAMMTPATALLWNYLPKLRFVQFPWRWTVVLAVAVAIATALAATRRALVWWIVLACVLSATGAYLVRHTWWDSEDVNAVKTAVDSGAGFEGTDEYDPLGDDRTDVPQNQPQASLITDDEADPLPSGDLRVIRWTAEQRIVVARVPHPAVLRLRLLHHPAWAVTLNGKPAQTGRTNSYDAILVYLPAGESRVEARFTRTADRVAGGWVSIFAAAIAGLLFGFSKRRDT
ncbi:MAG: hypothetical protein JSS69_00730 [Acidobacteria bacterium]|nr:hypothetical protein [Acidobacteriota bacterium]MBS1864418.1 hypothetical protein [Acidobacteriota bacterium]